uniref:Uncharacterized protein n=1 Tax=Pseudo-nitzschia australis TaxID=44445 RepID=A0A7S4AUM9_9STRA
MEFQKKNGLYRGVLSHRAVSKIDQEKAVPRCQAFQPRTSSTYSYRFFCAVRATTGTSVFIRCRCVGKFHKGTSTRYEYDIRLGIGEDRRVLSYGMWIVSRTHFWNSFWKSKKEWANCRVFFFVELCRKCTTKKLFRDKLALEPRTLHTVYYANRFRNGTIARTRSRPRPRPTGH